MAQVAINLTQFTQYPVVVNEKGEKTELRIFAKKRVTVPDGFKIEGNWKARNPGAIKEIEDKPAVTLPVVQAAADPTPTNVTVESGDANETAETESTDPKEEA